MARSSSVALRKPMGPLMPGFPPALWGMTVLTFAMLVFKQKRSGLIHRLHRPLVPLGALVLLIVIAGYLSGCAQGFPKLTTGTPTGTPAGTYLITVTGTSGTDKHSTTVTLTVQ